MVLYPFTFPSLLPWSLLPHQGQTLEAEGSFLRALALNPSHIGANTNMAHLCRLQERWSEAKEHYKKAILRRPKDGELHYYMGFVSERLGTRSGFKVGVSSFSKQA